MFKIIFISIAIIAKVSGHGMMLDPPNRSSLWRFDDRYPPNYNDNENFCGGINNQWNIHEGKCGVCGDEYNATHPQNNEHTGFYGRGKIVATYTSGQMIDVSILLTANHIGFFEYSLCEIKDEKMYESGEDCFKILKLENGNDNYQVTPDDQEVLNRVELPKNYKCDHCVLRWHYRGGNNWGICEDGSEDMGCGAQETFRSCADIKII